MAANWDSYSRQGLDLATTVTSVGFTAAKISTRLGFSIARGLASTAVGATTAAVDLALFGGSAVARPVCGHVVHTVLTVAEQLALAPIHLSEYITSTSLLAAHSSINVLSVVFPGSSDASFSLASFIDLVRREWTESASGNLPEKQYGITQAARAMVGWVSLQGITQEWQEKQWFKYLKEIDVKEPPKSQKHLARKSSRIRVTSDVIFPGQLGPQIVAADIGEPEPSRSRVPSMYLGKTKSHISLRSSRGIHAGMFHHLCPFQPKNAELKANLRRLSKMVLAGYGGASLLFFGISPSVFVKSKLSKTSTPAPTSEAAALANEKTSEEAKLASAIDESEAASEAIGDNVPPPPEPAKEFSWWDLLLGKHDQELFELSTAHDHHDEDADAAKKKANKSKMKATAVVRNEHLMPRFWVLTDHGRGQIVLVIRGTMSLNEIAVDLTCDPEWFEPASTPPRSADSDSESDSDTPLPGQFAFPRLGKKSTETLSSADPPKYHVHGGMLKMARAMGGVGNPVHLAVLEALHKNPDFDLILCGHSLGAGVAAMLGMMWADPKTCLTVQSSGLPVGRQVQVYCFAPPCLTDTALSRLTDKLIVSLVYSHDVVSRLSLGSVRDLKNAAMWLCEAEANGSGEGWNAITARVNKWKDGKGTQEDMDWLVSVRKTLEANMQNTSMYPPGRVLWAMRDGDLHPAHQRHTQSAGQTPQTGAGYGQDKLRVFEVQDVEKVFSQMVFARDMLTAHLPHQYDQVIHDLL